MKSPDVVVVGAGPAGLHAALSAAKSHCQVLIIENGIRPGGQYWRHMPLGRDALNKSLHRDFAEARSIFDEVSRNANIELMQGAQIWGASVEAETVVLRITSSVNVGEDAQSKIIRTSHLILATGAHDRPLPFPGWDIPGIMTPGGAQSLLKGHGVIAGKRMVIAGSGPFLLPVASSLADQGVEIAGLFEARSPLRWLKYAATLFSNPDKLAEGLHYTKILKRHKIQTKYRKAVIAAHANEDGTLAAVTVARINPDFAVVSGSERRIECDAAAVGWGFTPDTSLASALNLPMMVDIDGAVIVAVNDRQMATNQNHLRIYAAGEITGIGGASLASSEGAIAGFACARELEKISESQYLEETKGLARSRARAAKFATALKQVYSIESGWKTWLAPSTLMCRCEEVSCGQISDAMTDLGARSVRDVKIFTRAGMGMCQGRICGRIVADYLDANVDDRIRSTVRPIIAPISLGELAREPLL